MTSRIPARNRRSSADSDPLVHSPVFHAIGLLDLTLAGDRICGMTRFDNSTLPSFGLPKTLA